MHAWRREEILEMLKQHPKGRLVALAVVGFEGGLVGPGGEYPLRLVDNYDDLYVLITKAATGPYDIMPAIRCHRKPQVIECACYNCLKEDLCR